MEALAQYGESACTATNVEHTIARLKCRLIKQDPPRPFTAEQFHDRVIER
jgi:hypothetical protein